MRLVLVPIVALLACASCAPAPARPSTPEARPAAAPAATAAPAAPAVEMAPAPYTVAQIRDACPTGRRLVFKVEEAGKPVRRSVTEFVKSDASGADVRSYDLDASGKEVDAKSMHATWEELRAHAEFPKDRVEIKHRTVSIPSGTLECQVYKVTEDGSDAAVTTYYFADTLPGPPVFFYAEKGGKRVETHTLESSTGAK